MQWKYIAGNNWGICKDGNGAVGCGEQEEFRACSDIAIGKGAASAIPTIKPPVEVKPDTDKWPTNVNENEINHDHEHDVSVSETNEDVPTSSPPNIFGAIIAMFTFFLVLCAFIAIYFYFYHGNVLKRLLRMQQHQQKTSLDDDASFNSKTSSTEPPIRPPRTKRISQSLNNMHNEHTIIKTSRDKDDSDV